MKKKILLSSLIVVLFSSSVTKADVNLCTIKIGDRTGGSRDVLLMGGNAYNLLQKYISEAEKRGVKIDVGNLVIHFYDGAKLNTQKIHPLERLTLPVMRIWEKKLSKVEARYKSDELKKAHGYGWDIVCIPQIEKPKEHAEKSKEKAPEPKKGECNTQANVHINLGISFINNKQLDNAIKEFAEAIKLSPTCPLAYANLVSAYVLKKDINLAIETYKLGLEKAGDDGFLHLTGAMAYTKRGDFDLALRSLEKSLDKGYRNVDALVSEHLKDLRTARKREFCDLMTKHAIPMKDCLR